MKNEVKVLLVEDNDHDAELITLALEKLETPVMLERACDGVEAMEILNRDRMNNVRIALVLLDIKLPRMNGMEVLSKMKTSNDLKTIPVVMFTSSREERDVMDCYLKGANAYVVKPINFNELVDVLRNTGLFWCSVNEIPPGKRQSQ